MYWKNIFLLLLMFFSAALAHGQSAQISGVISDSKTNELLPLATVFINNTTIGSASDVNGKYTLKNIQEGPVEIVVSYVGYESSRIQTVVQDRQQLVLNIRLVPSAVELPKIEIKGSRDKEWAKQYQKFEKIFLGENSTGAKIINPGIIDIKEEDKGRVLLASATEPIEIENPGLGYHIFYYLRKFQSDKQGYSIVGDMRFQLLDDKDKTAAWDKRRKDIYSGSLRHLLVSLINNRTAEEGFQLYVDLPNYNPNVRSSYFSMNKGVVPFRPDSVVSPGKKEGEFRLQFKKRIEVHYVNKVARIRTYKDIPSLVGWLDATNGFVEVNAQGTILNLANLITSGYLSEARIASQLPNDYKP